jgi:hypothetical protein
MERNVKAGGHGLYQRCCYPPHETAGEIGSRRGMGCHDSWDSQLLKIKKKSLNLLQYHINRLESNLLFTFGLNAFFTTECIRKCSLVPIGYSTSRKAPQSGGIEV